MISFLFKYFEPCVFVKLDDINECLNYPCLNGGACENTEGGYNCRCTEGYLGDTCAGVLLFLR